jgi:hypothetical protein
MSLGRMYNIIPTIIDYNFWRKGYMWLHQYSINDRMMMQWCLSGEGGGQKALFPTRFKKLVCKI